MVSALLVAALALPAAAAELPAGVVAVPLSRGQKLDAYYAQFQVGTPPQTEYLKVDTGSPRYSFMDPRNSVCMEASKPCSEFGTFDNTTSSYVINIHLFHHQCLITYALEPATTKGLGSRMP